MQHPTPEIDLEHFYQSAQQKKPHSAKKNQSLREKTR